MLSTALKLHQYFELWLAKFYPCIQFNNIQLSEHFLLFDSHCSESIGVASLNRHTLKFKILNSPYRHYPRLCKPDTFGCP